MEFRQLRYFAAVLKCGSFAVAASELGVTQPALSKSIRVLEQDLGVPLLDRGPTGVRPTTFGAELLSYAHLILAQLSEAEQEIGAMRGAQKGALRLGCVPAALRAVVPAALKAFAKNRPNVQMSVSEGLNDALVEGLRAGKLDMIVVAQPAEALEPDLENFVLAQEPMDIICNQNHPLARKDNVLLRELADFGWVVPTRLEPDRRHLERLFSSNGLPPPNIALETTSVLLAQSILKDNIHLSYLPRSSMHARHSDLVALPLVTPTWRRTTIVAYRRKSAGRPLLSQLMQELRKAQQMLEQQMSAELPPSRR